MKTSYLNILELQFKSSSRPDTTLVFKPGLNIIHGASDTGKSFSLDSIDFILGSSKPLKDFSERAGYEKVSGIFKASSAEAGISIERGINGGDFSVTEEGKDSFLLSKKHNSQKDNNISKFLLSLINFEHAEIKTNKSGKKRGLSFRDLTPFILIEEGDITKTNSPALSGQYISVTAEKSVFKLLLTGSDDSSYLVEDNQKMGTMNDQIIDHLIHEYTSEIAGNEYSLDDIEIQIEKLDSTIKQENELIEGLQSNLNFVLESRKVHLEDKEKLVSRLTEIDSLLANFSLLEKHYLNDLLRLEAIKESGILLNFLDAKVCPLCGTSPENQDHVKSCDGDLNSVIEAANAEIDKIVRLRIELKKTVDELNAENATKNSRLVELSNTLELIQDKIVSNISPKLISSQTSFSELITKKFEAIKVRDTIRKVGELESRKSFTRKHERQSIGDTEPSGLAKSVVGEFCAKVESVLKSWGFPDVGNVYFDEKDFDFVISNKPRGSFGKGLRAITHAAFTISLLEYCISKSLPHPGFVVLDSPLLAYKDPDPGDGEIEKTDLKDKFYKYLSGLGKKYQIIIFENVEPQPDLVDFHEVHFTKNQSSGRYGLFPEYKASI